MRRHTLLIAAALAPGALLTGSALIGHPVSGGADLCALHMLAGLWCPLCGATRATRALATGDLAGALGYNPFTLAADAWLASLAIRALTRRLRPAGAERAMVTTTEWWTVAAALAAFGIIRNLPGMWHYTGPLLGPALT